MAGRKDYYSVLGVGRDAEQDEIKRAYRRLARKLHPDVNPGDAAAEERFKEISEAYHVLGDKDRRRKYDSVGPEAFAQQFDLSDFAEQFSGIFRGGRTAGGGGFGLFEDLLGGTGGGFSAHAGPPPPQRGQDVRVPLQLTLEEAMAGVERTIGYREADGKTRRVRARIPAGVRAGSRVRVKGRGAPGVRGGPAGDLYVNVSLQPHPRFSLDGDDLRTNVPITVYEAALGGRIPVPTLDGTATIVVPAGTQSGQVFRLRGHGVPRSSGPGRGDLMAQVSVELPSKPSPGFAALVEQMRDEHAYDPRDGSGPADNDGEKEK